VHSIHLSTLTARRLASLEPDAPRACLARSGGPFQNS
jgi:hypothetical protein